MLYYLFYVVSKPWLLKYSAISFYVAWNYATNHISYLIIGLDAITYNRIVIIDMYNVWFTSRYSPYFLNLQTVTMGILPGAQSSILNFFNIYLIYLVCEMNMPLSIQEICKPRRNDNSLRIYISNFFFISIANSLHIFSCCLKNNGITTINQFYLIVYM